MFSREHELISRLKLDDLIAQTLVNHQFKIVINVPGYGGTQVFEKLTQSGCSNASIALNEEAAYSIAIGASLYGTRSAVLIKTHGLAKMMNALCSSLSTGTNYANLIFAFDDSAGKSSDNIFDAKKMIVGSECPFILLGNNPEDDINHAIELSEKLKLPVIILVDCEKMDEEHPFQNLHSEPQKLPFAKNPLQNVACPPLTKIQRKILLSKIEGTDAPPLSMPEVLINFPERLPEKLRSAIDSYSSIFRVLDGINIDFMSGDAGTSSLFAFHKNQYVDACTYMGGSPGMALGAYLAGANKSWSVTGDFSFLAAGILGMNEIISRNAPIKIVIFKNGIAAATGGQPIPENVFSNFVKGHEKYITFISKKDEKEIIFNKLAKINESIQTEICICELN
jgi:TPP-dependent indolepyruvate ferredoxin oxidoreductase alpha subunit